MMEYLCAQCECAFLFVNFVCLCVRLIVGAQRMPRSPHIPWGAAPCVDGDTNVPARRNNSGREAIPRN